MNAHLQQRRIERERALAEACVGDEVGPQRPHAGRERRDRRPAARRRSAAAPRGRRRLGGEDEAISANGLARQPAPGPASGRTDRRGAPGPGSETATAIATRPRRARRSRTTPSRRGSRRIVDQRQAGDREPADRAPSSGSLASRSASRRLYGVGSTGAPVVGGGRLPGGFRRTPTSSSGRSSAVDLVVQRLRRASDVRRAGFRPARLHRRGSRATAAAGPPRSSPRSGPRGADPDSAHRRPSPAPAPSARPVAAGDPAAGRLVATPVPVHASLSERRDRRALRAPATVAQAATPEARASTPTSSTSAAARSPCSRSRPPSTARLPAVTGPTRSAGDPSGYYAGFTVTEPMKVTARQARASRRIDEQPQRRRGPPGSRRATS